VHMRVYETGHDHKVTRVDDFSGGRWGLRCSTHVHDATVLDVYGGCTHPIGRENPAAANDGRAIDHGISDPGLTSAATGR